MNRILYLVGFCLVANFLSAQDLVQQTFKDYNVINTHSVETLPARKLDVRIGHRFGDLVGARGGWDSFYGLENAQDVMIGAAYGITDKFSVGLHRTKGAGSLTRLVNLTGKYRLLHQKTDGSMPLSLTFLGITSISTMIKSDSPDVLNSFPKGSHRLVYCAQLLMARKFGNAFSLQLIPSYVHRNLVTREDENGLFSLGLATRVQVTQVMGIIADATFPISTLRTAENDYYPSIGIGFEFDTGGHVFQLNFTNATGIMETDYIPYTQTNWADGEFRLGFTISRLFNL